MPNSEIKIPQEWPGAHYLGQDEIDAVSRVIRSQSLFRYYGPDLQHEVDQLEKEFAAYVGVKYCLGVSHGTAALQVAISAMGVGPGDEVLVPGYFWVSTVGAVVRSGAIPVLVDVDDSFSMDPADLEKKITNRTKLAIVVHMGGVMGQVSKISEICKAHSILLLEDCAQASGVNQDGKKAGSFGDMAIFSFQINKNITAGEGGAVVTNDKELYEKSFAIHDLGYIKDSDGNWAPNVEDRQLWGIGCRMSELTAAVVRVQLRKIDAIIGAMRDFKNELKSAIVDYAGVSPRPVADPQGDGGAFLKITVESEALAWEFKEKLIENGMHVKQDAYYPIHMLEWGLHIYYNISSLVNKKSICGHHSVWELEENKWAQDITYSKGTLPHLDSLIERSVLICIPSRMTAEQKEVMKNALVMTCDQMNFTKL